MGAFNSFATTPRVVVGISDFAVSNNQDLVLTTYALGSCVGVLIYGASPRGCIAGLLHAMLPRMKLTSDQKNPLMFVDTGLNQMMQDLAGFGLKPPQAKVALLGGASVNSASDFFRIGAENVAAVKAYCKAKAMRIGFEDTGGKINRTMHFSLGKMELEVKKPQGIETIKLS